MPRPASSSAPSPPFEPVLGLRAPRRRRRSAAFLIAATSAFVSVWKRLTQTTGLVMPGTLRDDLDYQCRHAQPFSRGPRSPWYVSAGDRLGRHDPLAPPRASLSARTCGRGAPRRAVSAPLFRALDVSRTFSETAMSAASRTGSHGIRTASGRCRSAMMEDCPTAIGERPGITKQGLSLRRAHERGD